MKIEYEIKSLQHEIDRAKKTIIKNEKRLNDLKCNKENIGNNYKGLIVISNNDKN